MKNLFLIAVILFSGLNLFAQETTITKAEFDKAMMGNLQALRNQPYRTIDESENQGLSGVSKMKVITEHFAGNSRTIIESDSVSLSSKTERISINGKKFIRKLNAPWQEDTQAGTYKPSPDWETKTNETIYKSLGEKIIDDKKAQVFQVISNRITLNKSNGFQSDNKDTTTYYFDESGLMFRSESNVETISKGKDQPDSGIVNKPFKGTSKRTRKVEIDQSIRIEAPQIG
jgi:hypothetical protein